MATAGGLSKAEMVAQLKNRMPDLLIDSKTDEQLGAILDGAYRFTLPEEVDGLTNEDVWQFETVAGVDLYTWPDFVHSVTDVAFVDDYRVQVFRSPETFWFYERPEENDSGRPYTVLAYGRELTLASKPDIGQADTANPGFGLADTGYTVRIPIRAYPRLGIPDLGLDHRPTALAVVSLAALELAEEYGHYDLRDEHEATAGRYISQLRVRANGTGRAQLHRRSY